MQFGKLTISGRDVSLHPAEPAVQEKRDKRKPKVKQASSRVDSWKPPSAEELSGVLTIQILNIPKITEKHLKSDLENEARGKIDDVKIYEGNQTAVVRFKRQTGVYHIYVTAIFVFQLLFVFLSSIKLHIFI